MPGAPGRGQLLDGASICLDSSALWAESPLLQQEVLPWGSFTMECLILPALVVILFRLEGHVFQHNMSLAMGILRQSSVE